jgi:hypothetical protein
MNIFVVETLVICGWKKIFKMEYWENRNKGKRNERHNI